MCLERETDRLTRQQAKQAEENIINLSRFIGQMQDGTGKAGSDATRNGHTDKSEISMADESGKPRTADDIQPSGGSKCSSFPIDKLRSHQLLSKSDLAFLMENSEMTEEVLGELLDNLKRTLENYRGTAH